MVTTAPEIVRLPRPAISAAEAHVRASRLRLVLTDCDGVLTDGGVYYSESGEALRRFSVRDGMGVERLRRAGVKTVIVTRERSDFATRRAEKLGLPHVFVGVQDKGTILPTLLQKAHCAVEEVAFIGDDVNDLELLEILARTGLTGAPADAMPEVAAAVHYRCQHAGGSGAFREFAEWILSLRTER